MLCGYLRADGKAEYLRARVFGATHIVMKSFRACSALYLPLEAIQVREFIR